nr:response regulator [uncultured Pedobacter sp.]
MEKFTCIIIDEELKESENLSDILTQNDFVKVLATVTNVKEGLSLVNDKEPNLLFLAVKGDDLSALKFIEKIKKQPTIIFLTNNNDSVKTFEVNKLHYLKKPLKATEIQQLIASLQKTHQQIALKMQGLLGKLKFED